jgi:hypothetical protein
VRGGRKGRGEEGLGRKGLREKKVAWGERVARGERVVGEKGKKVIYLMGVGDICAHSPALTRIC